MEVYSYLTNNDLLLGSMKGQYEVSIMIVHPYPSKKQVLCRIDSIHSYSVTMVIFSQKKKNPPTYSCETKLHLGFMLPF